MIISDKEIIYSNKPRNMEEMEGCIEEIIASVEPKSLRNAPRNPLPLMAACLREGCGHLQCLT
jgi:hypothetical protein